MYCPSCKDEFRAGFTRCAACNLDLVDDLSTVAANAEETTKPRPAPPSPMAEYCGFFSLDEARAARDRLRGARIRADIVIRESPGSDLGAAPDEEYWLRVEASRYARVPSILGFDASETEGEAGDAGATAGLTGRFGPKIIAPAAPLEFGADSAVGDHFLCSECDHKVAVEEPFCPNCGARFEDD